MSAEATQFTTDRWAVAFSCAFILGRIVSGETGQENGCVIPSATGTAAK